MSGGFFIRETIIIFIFSIFIGSCSDQPGNKAEVSIYTGRSSQKKNAVSTRAPANITGLALTVTAEGSTVFQKSYTLAGNFDTISLKLTPGPARTFSLTATGGGETYTGSTTVDLEPGSNTVTIAMGLTVGATFNITSDPNSTQHDEPMSLALDNDYIYVAGYYKIGATAADKRWRIEKRSKVDGSY